MILLIWVIGAVIVGLLGKGKGSSFILWFILGIVLDPILAMILLFATK